MSAGDLDLPRVHRPTSTSSRRLNACLHVGKCKHIALFRRSRPWSTESAGAWPRGVAFQPLRGIRQGLGGLELAHGVDDLGPSTVGDCAALTAGVASKHPSVTRRTWTSLRAGEWRRLRGTAPYPLFAWSSSGRLTRGVRSRTGRTPAGSDQTAADPPVPRETSWAAQNPPGFHKSGAAALGKRQGSGRGRKSRVNGGLISVAAGLLLRVRSFRISSRSSRWPMWPSYAPRSPCSRWRLSSPAGWVGCERRNHRRAGRGRSPAGLSGPRADLCREVLSTARGGCAAKSTAPEGVGTLLRDTHQHLRVYVTRPRRKLEADPSHPRHLHQRAGHGTPRREVISLLSRTGPASAERSEP